MRIVRNILAGWLLCAALAFVVRADTFHLVDGQTVSGEIVAGSANDGGLQIRVDDGKYERVNWEKFSQEDLKKFKENPKYAPFVDPLIEISAEERSKRTEVVIKPVPRLERPKHESLLGAMFSSGPGILMLFLVYVASLFAAYEISIFRAQPAGLVCGVAAVLPLIGPIIFLCLPSRAQPEAEEPAPQGPAVIQPFAVPPPGGARPAPQAESSGSVPAPGTSAESESAEAAEPAGLRLAQAEAPSAASMAIPQTQVFQRGAFTFNRRFFENKFPGFFGVIKRDADKEMVLVIKAARGEYTVQRISRIAANELHAQVQVGQASEEIMIPFSEIQEIKLKHKSA